MGMILMHFKITGQRIIVSRRKPGSHSGRQPGEPLSAWLLRATKDPALADLQSRLQELLRLHYRYRFDPHGLPEADREALGREAKDCLVKLR